MLNKRGAEGLPISTIIIVILAILVLVIVAASFTGGMKTMFEKIKSFLGVYSAADEEAARQMCDTWCTTERYWSWNNHKFENLPEDKQTCTELGSVCPEAATTK